MQKNVSVITSDNANLSKILVNKHLKLIITKYSFYQMSVFGLSSHRKFPDKWVKLFYPFIGKIESVKSVICFFTKTMNNNP